MQLPSSVDETRLIDMSGRIFSRLAPAYVVVGLVFLPSGPIYGWLPLALFVVEAVKMFVAHKLAQSGYRPALVYSLAQYSSPVFLGAAVFLTGGIASPYIVIAAVHGGLFPVVFSKRHQRTSFIFLILTVVVAALGPAHPAEFDNVLRLASLFATLVSLRIIASVMTQTEVQHRAEAIVDNLTGIANRRAFDRRLQKLSESGTAAALIICDIDNFKTINDKHAHSTGDQVLVDVASELSQAFRTSDTTYRIGGDEFALIAEGVTEEFAQGMADSIRQRVAVTFPGDTEVSLSLGLAMIIPGESSKEWFVRADEALFEAKRSGRNRVEVATS